MEIIRASHSGFCFGVKQAIDKALNEADNSNEPIFSLGPLIHNKIVTDELAEKGVKIIDDLSTIADNSKVIIRSHGVGKYVYDTSIEKNISIIDGTCPYVKKIHNLVKEAYDSGKTIIIVGDENHPEVIGINGWCNNSAIILNSPKDIDQDDLFVVAQTTLKKETFDDVVSHLKGKNIEIKNTICNATKMRQDSCKELAEKVEAMVVIGDKSSSNSKKLFEISKKYCKNAYFIDDIFNLPLQELQKYNKIGVAAGASTPENAIKEVIANMSDKITKEESMLDYMEEIEKSLRLPRTGELVSGKVHHVTDKEVIVNLGCKKDGMIPLSEITLEGDVQLKDLFNIGDEITAKVLKTDDGDGTILLSKKKLEVSEHWEDLAKALEEKSIVNVTVQRTVNGGVVASYKEVQGFIPLSQLSDRYVENASEFIGKTLPVRVTRVDMRKNKAIFSHKAKLVEEKQLALEEIWNSINVGDIVEGKVMRFTDYGAFIDIGGLDGLLHISEISWGKLRHPQEILAIDDTINVQILSMNKEKGKISLGLKQTMPEPWSIIDEKYQVGQTFEGKVVQIKEYGCFVELEPGLDGLVHISEVSHNRVEDINTELKVGDDVSAQILEIDKDRKRISLSIKATLEKPVKEEVEVEAE